MADPTKTLIGHVTVAFTPQDGSAVNITGTKCSINPSVTYAKHKGVYGSAPSVRRTDRSVVTDMELYYDVTVDELTTDIIDFFLLGNNGTTNVPMSKSYTGTATLKVIDADDASGAELLNHTGFKCLCTPQGALEVDRENFSSIVLRFEVMGTDADLGTYTVRGS